MDKNPQNEKSNVKQEYQPVVKFHDIKESVLQAVQTLTGNKPSPRNHDLLENAESNYNSKNNNTNTNIICPLLTQDFTFEIDEDIDINLKGLKYIVLVKPVVDEISQSCHMLSKTAQLAQLLMTPN